MNVDILNSNHSCYNVLILGNGFDLCAGLKSTFKNFADSEFWPFRGRSPHPDCLAAHLNRKKGINTWFDLEYELYLYALQHDKNSLYPELINIDLEAFKQIHQKLIEYLQDQINSHKPESPIPYRLLQSFMKMAGKNTIYTFNYTDPFWVYPDNYSSILRPVYYVHGSLAEKNIIIGVGDKHQLYEQYNFLYKAMNPNYRSSGIVSDLEDADNIIFFGHSLGDNDHDYLNQFFVDSCYKRVNKPKRRITFFIRSEDDQLNMKSRLRDLTDKKLQRLMNMCEVNFIPTDNKELIKEVLSIDDNGNSLGITFPR